MRLLLDTHILLWVSGRKDKLSAEALALIEDQANDLFFSVASLWEIVIKRSGSREDLEVEPIDLRRSLLDNDYGELPILGAHTLMVASLPNIHRDPFDRILIAQTLVEDMVLLTADRIIARYPAPVRLM